jgi:hypothetical protein
MSGRKAPYDPKPISIAMMPDLLTMRQVADILQVQHQTIRKWVTMRHIPVHRIVIAGGRGLVRIHRAEVERMIAQGYQAVED